MELKEITNDEGKKYSLVYNKGSMSRMDRINSSLESKTFIKRILKDYDALNLLCNHPSTLSIFEDYNFPLLFIIDEKIESKIEDYFEDIAEEEHIKTDHIVAEVTKRAKPLVEKILKKYPKYFKGKKLEILRKVLSGRGFEAFSLISKSLPDDKKQELFRNVVSLASGDLIPGGISFVNSSKAQVINAGIKSRKKIIKTSNITCDEYESLIELLERKYKVIEPLASIFWCNNKYHEHYSFFIFGHMAQPEIQCPICKNKLLVATFYYFKPILAELLMFNEGLIQALTMFIIDGTERKWLPGVYLEGEDDSEKDFVIETSEKGYSIIEVKNFVKDNPRAQKSNIKAMMKQAIKHLVNYKKRGIVVEKVYLVSNYDYNEEIQRMADANLADKKFTDLNNVGLKIIGLNNINELNELKIGD